MIENRAYIRIEKHQNEIVSMLREIVKENTEIVFNEAIGMITSFDDDCFVQKLHNFVLMQSTDWGTKISILVVPCYHTVFIKYLDLLNNEVCTLFDVFARNIKDERIMKDSKMILNKIGKKNIDTINAFINCNMNSLKAANELYLHRNSFTYRLNQFIMLTDMDVRDIHTMMFLRLIINLYK